MGLSDRPYPGKSRHTTVNPDLTSCGATRCQVAEVRGWPWSNSTAGPDPPQRPNSRRAPPGIMPSTNPSNTLTVFPTRLLVTEPQPHNATAVKSAL